MTEHKEETITYGVGRFVIEIPAEMTFSGSYSMRTFDIKEVVWPETGWMEHTTATWKNLIDQIRQTDPPKDKTSSLIEEKEFSEIGKLCKAAFSYKDPRRPNRGYIDLLASSETMGLWISSFGKATGKEFMYEKATDLARAYRPPSKGEGRVAVLPDKDSFYLRYGAIDLPFEYAERVNILFRNHPIDRELVLDVEMDVVQQVEQHGLIDRLAAMILTKFVPGLKIEKIRTRKRNIAGMMGEEVIYRGIEEDGDSGLYFAWEYPGQKNSAHFPNIQIGIRAQDDNLAEKLALWDAVLDSMRPAGR
ncbi:MAG: hypothetical protein KFF50_10410 [Desulfatitalea sp.]|nr:hypothetical protein [Desulfatitalea sp.]